MQDKASQGFYSTQDNNNNIIKNVYICLYLAWNENYTYHAAIPFFYNTGICT